MPASPDNLWQSSVDATLSSDNSFTQTLLVTNGTFLLAISGNFGGTLTLQMRPNVRAVTHNWISEATYTGPAVAQSISLKGQWEIQVGFLPGSYVNGSAHITLAC